MKRVFLIAFLIATSCSFAYADGGRLRFSKTAGPFLVTLFTMPEPLTPGPTDFSVMVQDSRSGAILNDARVTLEITPQERSAATLRAVATHGISTNLLLQAADLDLPKSGTWSVHLKIEEAARSAALDSSITVEPGSRKAKLVWIFGSLPLMAVVLFILHQRQKMFLLRRQFAVTTRKI